MFLLVLMQEHFCIFFCILILSVIISSISKVHYLSQLHLNWLTTGLLPSCAYDPIHKVLSTRASRKMVKGRERKAIIKSTSVLYYDGPPPGLVAFNKIYMGVNAWVRAHKEYFTGRCIQCMHLLKLI